MAKDKINVLSEEFLMDLFKTCTQDAYVLSVVTQHVEPENMPDKDSVEVLKGLQQYYKKYQKLPQYSSIRESLRGRGAVNLWSDAFDTSDGLPARECLEMLETYLKSVKFQKCFKEAGVAYNSEGYDAAAKKMAAFMEWQATFSLTDTDYTDVVATFDSRFIQNRSTRNNKASVRQVNRFYIDELDNRNAGKDLRTQLTYILAATGVGKSHAIRWIGSNACLDGLNVLHFQLEGSKEEVLNAYSAALVGCNAYGYEQGLIRDEEFALLSEQVKNVAGCLYVKSYPKFNRQVTTADIKEGIMEFKKQYSISPDVVTIDSADLLSDVSGRRYAETGERHKRIAVARDLKDLAADENVWIVATYQSTVENQEWLNDEKNVFTEYNTAEAKGLSRPLTHLITLNQSSSEYKEHTMRINVAKSRFFRKGDVFKIATDYDHEVFYDKKRTININKTL